MLLLYMVASSYERLQMVTAVEGMLSPCSVHLLSPCSVHLFQKPYF